jgi:hypothetical protein
VALVALDMAVELVDLGPATFEGLQEDAAAVAEDASDAAGRVVRARLRQDGLSGLAGIGGGCAAGVYQVDLPKLSWVILLQFYLNTFAKEFRQ